MHIGIAISSLAPLMAAGVAAVLEGAGLDFRQVPDPVTWAGAVKTDCVLVAGCASPADCDLFLRIYEVAPRMRTIAVVAAPTLSQPALEHGAAAVLPVTMSTDWLVTVVKAINAGLMVAPLPSPYRAQASGSNQLHLTGQEIDWLRILGSGVTIGRLADTAGYSERNMKRHLANTYQKLGTTSRVEALIRAAQLGLIGG
jgi:DNA-binding NarL/FixJ family response regulator